MFELRWGPAGGSEVALPPERAVITSVHELDETLDHLEELGRSGSPFLVLLVNDEVGRVGISVGDDRSHATYERADGEPPYLLSAGADTAGDPLVFFVDGDWTELDSGAAISTADAREAMRRFFAGEVPPANLSWVET